MSTGGPVVRRQSLRRSADFRRAYRQGVSAAGKYVVVYAVQNGLPIVRTGYPVGKKYGGAVQRNRIRRLMKESVRLCQLVPGSGYDLVLVPRRRIAQDAPGCQSVLADLESVLNRLNLSEEAVRECEQNDGQG